MGLRKTQSTQDLKTQDSSPRYTVDKVDLLIFDLDGTLVDSRIDISNSMNHILKELGFEPVTFEEVERNIGGGIRNLIKGILRIDDKEILEKAYLIFLDFYSSHLLDNTVLYPGVKDILEDLHAKKKAVITNKLTHLSLRILEGLNVERYFTALLGGDSLNAKKPSPLPLIKIMDELKVSPTRTIMIGDSKIDIEAGKGAGVITCGVTYGYGKKDELHEAGADFIIDNLIELKGFVI